MADKDKEKERNKDEEKGKERGKEKEKEKSKTKEKEKKEKVKDKEKEKTKDKEKEKTKEKASDKVNDKEKVSINDKEKEKINDKEKDKTNAKENDKEKVNDMEKEQVNDKEKEKASENEKKKTNDEKVNDKDKEKSKEKEKDAEKGEDIPSDRSKESCCSSGRSVRLGILLVVVAVLVFSALLGLLAWLGVFNVPHTILNKGRVNASTTTLSDNYAAALMDKIIRNFVSEDRQRVSYLALKHSPFFKIDMKNDWYFYLQHINLTRMGWNQRKAFFINTYNLLAIDAILSMDDLPTSPSSVRNFWRRYSYRIGPHTLNLDEIHHGILRGNRPNMDGTVFFKEGDNRTNLVIEPDHRVHATLNYGSMSCAPLNSYRAENLEDELSRAMSKLCSRGIKVDEDGDLQINSIFKWYSSDFGKSEADVLRRLSGCVKEERKRVALMKAAESRNNYEYFFDWNLNVIRRLKE